MEKEPMIKPMWYVSGAHWYMYGEVSHGSILLSTTKSDKWIHKR